MPLTYADRVSETTTTSGLGSVSLGGATLRHQTFATGIGNGNQCAYVIEEQNGTDWEVGYGVVTTGSPDTLSRDTILASSNSGLKVNFAGGVKNVFVVVPAAEATKLHVAVTLGGGSDSALSLSGQQLTLADVLTPTEHTAIGDSSPHHAAVTVSDTSSIDLTLSGQQISGAVLPAGVDHNSLANLAVGDVHTQYALSSFKTLVISGQSDVVADARDDTLTLAAGSNITLTTDAATDTVTIAASGGVTDHGALTGLLDDDHTQYGLKSGALSQFGATTSAQLFGVISDETGGGGVLVGNASPTFTTQITSPVVIGGTGTTSTLTLKPTSGAGTTNSDIVLAVGTDGGTEALRISYDGRFASGISPYSVLLTMFELRKDWGAITVEDNTRILSFVSTAARNTSAWIYASGGIVADVRIGATNDQNWTADLALRGMEMQLRTVAGSTGTVTGAVNYYGRNPIVSGSPITNVYGFFQDELTTGSNNWAIYTDGATKSYFGGRVGIGTGVTLPTGQLHVDQASTTGAIPVLLLDQADVSEEFIRFIGTAAAATLTQSIVAEGDVTTATRAGFVKVYVQDDGNQITDQAYFVPLFTLA